MAYELVLKQAGFKGGANWAVAQGPPQKQPTNSVKALKADF